MTFWQDLDRELDAWARAGRQAPLWWRDDDAVEPGPALDQLLSLGPAEGWPLVLAVIPGRCSSALPKRLSSQADSLVVVQHGFAHRNHAAGTAKKCELGPERPQDVVLEELARGFTFMSAAFGARFRPLLVPPWNRIDENLLPRLAALGLGALSTYGAAHRSAGLPGLQIANSHLDIMRWAQPRGFLGEATILEQLIGLLRAQRTAGGPPIGLLTHHLAHDGPAWDFLAMLSKTIAKHDGAGLLTLDKVLAMAGSGSEVAA